jgi:hypothetical protein
MTLDAARQVQRMPRLLWQVDGNAFAGCSASDKSRAQSWLNDVAVKSGA